MSTSPEGMRMNEQLDKIELVLEWARDKGKFFDASFVESLGDQYFLKGELTEAQEEALDNIIEKFHIE